MTINEGIKRAHAIAVDNGFHGEGQAEPEFGTLLALVHSELSEALEAHRAGKFADIHGYYNDDPDADQLELFESKGDPQEKYRALMRLDFEKYIKDTVEDELADAVIRIFDLCGLLGIDLDQHIELKMEYNTMRGYKHGKQY